MSSRRVSVSFPASHTHTHTHTLSLSHYPSRILRSLTSATGAHGTEAHRNSRLNQLIPNAPRKLLSSAWLAAAMQQARPALVAGPSLLGLSISLPATATTTATWRAVAQWFMPSVGCRGSSDGNGGVVNLLSVMVLHSDCVPGRKWWLSTLSSWIPTGIVQNDAFLNRPFS